MSSSSRRAVITGLGVLNAIAQDADSFRGALKEGRNGIRAIRNFDASGLPVRIAGEIEGFNAKDYVDKTFRKNLRVMARTIQLAVAAAHLALEEGKVDKSALDPDRFGVEFGSGLIAMELIELAEASQLAAEVEPRGIDYRKWGKEGIPRITPLWMLKYLPNMLACQVAILHDARGPNNTITESDVAGLLALGEAYRILERNGADFFLVGGAESKLNPLSMVRQCMFEPLSRRNDEPEKACRPFDKDRDGLVLGEGGAVMIVEDLAHAEQRNARIYAEVVGFGSAFDREKNGRGLARAIRAALMQAGVGPGDIDHVNAHGLGSIPSDRWEAQGLHEVFGKDVPVFAPKANIGNLGAGGGISELAASVLALHHGELPGTLNHDTPDPECPITVHTGSPRPTTKKHAVKVSFTQMGQCAAVVIRKWE